MLPSAPRAARDSPCERLLHSSQHVRVGAFRCVPQRPDFAHAGAIEGYSVVFPRLGVWIQHQGEPPFVADSRVAVLYNQGQPYTRRPLCTEGDRSDFFSVSQPLAFSIARAIDPRVDEAPNRPYRVSFTHADAALYLRQRELFHRVELGVIGPFELEEAVILLIGDTLRRASGSMTRASGGARHQRDLVEDARAILARDVASRTTVRELADGLGASPYHLCRVFRRWTGSTLHEYLLDLRLRTALERINDDGVDLSRIAFELGFSSHSHFTVTFRRWIGLPPSRLRGGLRGSVAWRGRKAGAIR